MSDLKSFTNSTNDNIELESKVDYCSVLGKTELQVIIGATNQVQNSADKTNDQDTSEKTSEDDNYIEQTNSKTSRELKLLLALSKEANLETNISHKRKSSESSKLKEKEVVSKISLVEAEPKKLNKVAYENRSIRYPITAESELELEIQENEISNGTDNSAKTTKRKRDSLSEVTIGGATEEAAKRNKKSFSNEIIMFKENKDIFCWRCHREGVNISCETCPRSYHQKCLKQTITNTEHWPCPECVAILKAESTQTRSEAMKGMTLEHLCGLLKFAVNRMIQCQGSEPFLHPVSDIEFPSYKNYIIQPMDLTKLEKNIKENLYGSTQAFEADAKWLLHNSIIFNSYQSKLTTAAKNIIKICKQEMAEVENCPSCYLNANTKKGTWFVEVCPKPHLLVWAKLKGFPYWPAKAMCTNSAGMVDVRFFGAHDRAWVHYKECYLFSEKDPNTFKQKRYDIEKCVEELNIYIKNLQKIYEEFRYAPFRTLLDPENEIKQLQMFLPKFKNSSVVKKEEVNKSEGLDRIEELKENKKDKHNSLEKKIELKESAQKDVDTIENIAGKQFKMISLESEENISETEQNEKSGAKVKPNGIEKFNTDLEDNDGTMEGYGTDDDINSEEIDLERRKTYMDKKSDHSDNSINIEEDEEDDTQVSSNICVDSTNFRGGVKTRGGYNNNAGKIKVLPRKISEHELPQKRQSLEEIPYSPQKISRRNSDQSVKSDSSRISNISDKINRVDISENMEITLGNEDIGCISISENISSNKSESSKESDYGVESKKKPVQVDIENTEFTISPSNKLKIADKLMKRLSEVGESSDDGLKSDDTKMFSAGEKKSPTDLLIEKFKGVIEHEIVNFGQSSTFSEEKEGDSQFKEVKSKSDQINIVPHKKAHTVSEEDKIPSEKSRFIPEIDKNISSVSNKLEIELTEITSDTKKTVSSNDKITQDSSNNCLSSKNVNSSNFNKNDKTETSQVINNNSLISSTCKTPAEKKFYSFNDLKAKLIPDVKPMQENSTNNETNDNKHFIAKESPKEKQQPVIKRKMDLIETSIIECNTARTNNNSHKINAQQRDIKSNGNSSKTDTETSTNKSILEKSTINQNVINIIEEFEDSEESDLMESIEIDKTNIFNIIHSSLSETKSKASVEKPPVESTEKKRKLSCDETTESQSKLVKLVPIESILNKNIEKDKNDSNSITLKKLLGRKMLRKPSSTNSTPRSSLSRRSSIQEIMMDDIKSEPESDDDFSESENLEAKRKYLSALNILEKVNDSEKLNKVNEIRTRARAEEKREKFRVVDNLTKVIDDVALNYSANHEGDKIAIKNNEMRTSVSQEGEIFVKSFAKIQAPKQRARKSFPVPSYIKSNAHIGVFRKESIPNIITQKKDILIASKNTIVTTSSKVVSSTTTPIVTPIIQPQIMPELGKNLLPRVILLPPNQAITYGTPIGSLSKATSAISAPITTTLIMSQPASTSTSRTKSAPNIEASQNYIPQNKEMTANTPTSSMTILNELLTQHAQTSQEPSRPPQQSEKLVQTITAINTNTVETNEVPQEEEFTILNSILPENVSKAVSDILLRPLPRLKPRPPGMLSNTFDEGIPSSAGNVTSRINSVAHRLGDYLRGMLIETLQDLGKAPNPETKITSLQLEIENLKHRHSVELSEMRKNICTILRDIQKSIVDERERIVDETRAACEAETIKRIELAKSKQWCANCPKEAQFYCCWNTSYCDYPCQQKHWPKHLGKCTQNMEKTSNAMTMRPPSQQLILRPTLPPKSGMGRVVAKPTKVYMNRTAGQSASFKTQLSSGNHLTVIETTPGNYELLGNGPIAVTGKILATTSNIFQSKFKAANVVTVSSPSTSRTAQKSTVTSNTTRSSTISSTQASLGTSMLHNDSD